MNFFTYNFFNKIHHTSCNQEVITQIKGEWLTEIMWILNALALIETHLYDLVSHYLTIFQILSWYYILNYIILLNSLYYRYLKCLNFMDIQLVVKRRKRPQTDNNTNCSFAEEISKLRNDLVGNFYDLRDEIINMKNIVIKKVQDENAQLKDTIVNLQHKVITFEAAMNSAE